MLSTSPRCPGEGGGRAALPHSLPELGSSPRHVGLLLRDSRLPRFLRHAQYCFSSGSGPLSPVGALPSLSIDWLWQREDWGALGLPPDSTWQARGLWAQPLCSPPSCVTWGCCVPFSESLLVQWQKLVGGNQEEGLAGVCVAVRVRACVWPWGQPCVSDRFPLVVTGALSRW